MFCYLIFVVYVYVFVETSLFKQCHKNVTMVSVFFKMADVNAEYFKVKLNVFKRWYPKVYKKKNLI